MFPLEAARSIVRRALDEDLGPGGDITTDACFPGGAAVTARLVFREGAVLAGLPLAALALEELARRSGRQASARELEEEGARVAAGSAVAVLEGDARVVLAAERVILNFVARLSGIATMTRDAVDEIAGLGCSIADTRKTTPGLRALEKYAVATGGGELHRATLDALVLVKDNHKEIAGGLGAALDAILAAGHEARAVEAEVETLDELDEALARGCGWVLLDNMPARTVAEAVRRCRGRARVEVSGGMVLGRLRPYAEAGADRISMGALTHAARSIDVALDVAPAGR